MGSPLGPVSGKYAAVNGVSTVRNWQASQTMAGKAYVASNTKGGTGREKGNKDWTGSYQQYAGIPAAMPGDTISFEGYVAPANGSSGSGPTWQGSAIVASIAAMWNWENADILQVNTNIEANGALTLGTAESVADDSAPSIYSPIGIPVKVLNGFSSGSFAAIPNVTQMTLNILSATKAYVNSSTNGNTQRDAGPIDWNASITIQEGDVSTLPFQVGDYVALQMFIDATNKWQLSWGLVQEFSNFEANRETGDIVSVQANIAMAGFDNSGNTGEIILPGASEPWWPFSL